MNEHRTTDAGMSVEEMERFAEDYGVVALLDHLGLDGLANEVNSLKASQEPPSTLDYESRWR